MYTVPVCLSITLTNAVQEYSLALPAATRYCEIQATTAVVNTFSFVTGGPYMPIPANTIYESYELEPGAKTLYFYTANAGAVMRVMCYPWKASGNLESKPLGA